MKPLVAALCSSLSIMYNALDVPEEPPEPPPHPIVGDWEILSLESEKAELADEISELEAEVEALKKEAEEYERRSSGSDNGQGGNNSARGSDGSNSLGGIQVGASFYTARCEGCSGITRTGYDVRQTIYTPNGLRVIAVDPSVIPLKSIVRVTLEDGSTFKAQALDVGSAIKGDRIDVLVETREEAYRLGRQAATVEIIEKGAD